MAIHHLHTEIEIDASAERVWAVLCDFSSYPQWNPFIKSVTGAPQQGARLQIVVQPSGGKAMRFKPLVLAAEKGRELRWLGRSEEHTSELQSRGHLVCRLLLEKKNTRHRGTTRTMITVTKQTTTT